MSTSPIDTMLISVAVTAGHAVCVRLAGDIDLTAEPDLASLAGTLAATGCTVVYIDLHGVTFAGTSLIKFLCSLASRLRGNAKITLCRPDAIVLQLIQLTGVHKVANVRHDLPADWTAPWAIARVPAPTPTAVPA